MTRAAAIAALVTGAVVTAWLSEPPAPSLRTQQGLLLPRAGFLHVLFAAQQQLVADYYWILTTHQIGSARTAEEAADIVHYAELATALDPGFRPVYWFAGVASVFSLDRDRFANVELSTEILEKGLRHFPSDFKLAYQLAQNHLHYSKDYAKAARLLTELAKLPDAPNWIASLAARLHAQTGNVQVGLELAKRMVASAENEETRAFYRQRLKEIRLEIILRRVDAEAEKFRKKHGREPTEFYELVKEGYLAGLPPDPLGGGYYLDPVDGRAHSSMAKHRFELIKPRWQQAEGPMP